MGRDYDYDWITDDDATIFCTELLYYSLKAVGIEIEARTTIVNRDVFTPDNLFEYLMSNSGEGGSLSTTVLLLNKKNYLCGQIRQL